VREPGVSGLARVREQVQALVSVAWALEPVPVPEAWELESEPEPAAWVPV
jgi:hypothetical protein